MSDQPPRRIPEWLSLHDIARAWSDETGESVTAFEERFRSWFKDFLLRNDYGDADGEQSGIPEEMLEGRQIWRETFETFCEERGLTKPRFWFPEARQASAPPEPVVAPAAPPPVESEEPVAEAPKPPKKKQEKPPPRRRAREGGSSFTWIAAGLVAAVVAGLIALWMRDMERPIAERQEAGLQNPSGPLAAIVPSSQRALSAAVVSAPGADSQEPVATALEPTVAEPESATAEPESATVAEPAATPEPTTAAAPAAAQVAAVSAGDRPAAPSVAHATATAAAAAPVPSEPPDEGLILLIQRELRAAGFDPGPLDGKLGTRLATAISAYQRANGLPASGRPSIDLLSRLARENLKAGRSAVFLPPPSIAAQKVIGADTTSVAKPDRKAAAPPPPFKPMPSLKPVPAPRGRDLVRSVQQRLATRGYYDGPLDGSLGPKTREAIRTYQRVQRYPATGQPSRALFEELEDYALEARALAEFREGAYEAAVATYSRIIQRNPQHADAYFNRGLAYKNSGHSEQALIDYKTAIQLNDSHKKAYFDRANILYQQGFYRDAVQDYFKALKIWLDLS